MKRVFCKDCRHMFWVLGEGPASCKASPLVVLDPVHGEIRGRVLCHEKNARMDCVEFTPEPVPRAPKVPDPPGSGWEEQMERQASLPRALKLAIVVAAAFLVVALWTLVGLGR